MNKFTEIPFIPYKIIEVLMLDNSQEVEDFWKLLKYSTVDALDKPNLTDEEKDRMIWRGEPLEQDYNIFLKPQISDSLDTAESQIQMRLYRYSTNPIDVYNSIVCFEADFITNDKTSLVYKDGLMCERTDLLENTFLNIFHTRDIQVGSGYFEFSKELSRSCQSLINISNSKSLYGRSCILGLMFVGRNEIGDECG